MFEYIKNKIDDYKKEQERQKQSSVFFLKNASFLEKISNKRIECFFHYLVKNYASDIITIEYSKIKKNTKELNQFYNDFFSKYEGFIIEDNLNIIINFCYIKKSILEKPFDDVVIAGTDNGASIFIKIHGKRNSLYLDELSMQDDIDNETIWWGNVFYYLIENICSRKEIVIEDIYNEMISKEK